MRKILVVAVIMALSATAWAGKMGKTDALAPINGDRVKLTLNGKDLIFYEDFEDSTMPADWTVMDSNGDGVSWIVGTTDDLGLYEPPDCGSYYAYYSDDDAGGGAPASCEILTTPAIDISGLTNLTLAFSYGFRSWENDDYLAIVVDFDGSVDTLDIICPDDANIAVYDLTDYLPASQIIISFVYIDEGGWNWAVAVDNVCLTTGAAEVHDVGITFNIVNFPITVNIANQVDFYVINYGNVDETDVMVVTNFGTVIDTQTIASLPAGDTAIVSMVYTPAAEEIVPIAGAVILPSDDDPTNNEVAMTEYAYPEGTIWAEGFEYISDFPPPNWEVINNDGGSYTWGWYSGYPHTGFFMTAVHWENPNNDDWLITGPITPEVGYYDSIGFFYAAYSVSYPEYLQVWAMSGQDVADTLALLWEVTENTCTDYQRQTVSLDAFDGMTIYIAFRSLSPDAYYNILDDIFYMKVEGEPTAVEEAGIESGLTVAAHNLGKNMVVTFALPKDMNVKVDLYDVSGRYIMNVASGRYAAGSHSVTVNAEALRSGVYFVSMKAGSQVVTKKVAVIH